MSRHFTLISGRWLTFTWVPHVKFMEIKVLMRATGLKKRKGEKDNVGEIKFVECETSHGRRVSLIRRESNLGSAVIVHKT